MIYVYDSSEYLYINEAADLKTAGATKEVARLVMGYSPDPIRWRRFYSSATPTFNCPEMNFTLEDFEMFEDELYELATDFTGSYDDYTNEVEHLIGKYND